MPFSTKLIFISTIIFSFISSYFVWRFGISSELWVVSVVFMMFFAAPSFLSLWNIDKRQALLSIITLSIFSLAIESIAIATGFPYGSFYYGGGLGPKVFGLAPLMVPFAWVPLVIGCYAIAVRFLKDWRVIPVTAVLLVIVDLVIDPGAYALQVWIWQDPGMFYGVPLQNFVGWFFSGLVGSFVLKKTKWHVIDNDSSSYLSLSLMGILTFWTGISFWYQMVVPSLIGVVLLSAFFVITARSQQ